MNKLSYILLSTFVMVAFVIGGGCKKSDGNDQSKLKAGYEADIKISLSHPYDVRNDDFELMFASSPEIEQVGVCLRKGQNICSRSSPNFFDAKLIYASNTRRFYALTRTALLEQNMVLELIGFDQTGREIGRRAIMFMMSGAAARSGLAGGGIAGSAVNGVGAGIGASGSNAESLIIRTCSGGSCHNNTYAANPSTLKGNADAAQRIRQGNMPPGNSMPQDERQAILQYMGQ